MLKKMAAYWLPLLTAALAVAFAPLPFASAPAQAVSRTFRIEARQYAYSPAELHVNPEDTVTIQLVSTDVVHGLYVDGYGASLQADPGQTAAMTFVANRAGSFRFRCNVTCGALHPFMIGKLIVGGDTALYRGIGLALLGAFAIFLFPRRDPQPDPVL